MNNNNNKFLDGFMLGAILGGVLVFALGTEKGKKIVKTIVQEGAEGLDQALRDFEDYELAIEKPAGVMSTAYVEESTPKNSNKEENSKAGEEKVLVKRFFRNSKRKL